MTESSPPSLAVLVDGRALADDEARPMWERFSAHMDAHQGDFDGFAAIVGFKSARVEVVDGRPTLRLSTSEAPPAQPARKRRGQRGGKRRRGRSGAGRPQRKGKPRGKPS